MPLPGRPKQAYQKAGEGRNGQGKGAKRERCPCPNAPNKLTRKQVKEGMGRGKERKEKDAPARTPLTSLPEGRQGQEYAGERNEKRKMPLPGRSNKLTRKQVKAGMDRSVEG